MPVGSVARPRSPITTLPKRSLRKKPRRFSATSATGAATCSGEKKKLISARWAAGTMPGATVASLSRSAGAPGRGTLMPLVK